MLPRLTYRLEKRSIKKATMQLGRDKMRHAFATLVAGLALLVISSIRLR